MSFTLVESKPESQEACDVLGDAQALLEGALELLSDPLCAETARASIPFALARAHALSMLGRLSRMRESAGRPLA